MPTSAGSRKRIPLSKHPTYESALAAKHAETKYSQEQLQIKKRGAGKSFDLLARIVVKPSTNNVENN
jgi:hypothetical protein